MDDYLEMDLDGWEALKSVFIFLRISLMSCDSIYLPNINLTS
jgi:hypothetical protein